MAVPDGFASVLIGELGVPKRATAAFELSLPDLKDIPVRLGGCIM
jgi:hypothetical protein